jgi:hypothetical protein
LWRFWFGGTSQEEGQQRVLYPEKEVSPFVSISRANCNFRLDSHAHRQSFVPACDRTESLDPASGLRLCSTSLVQRLSHHATKLLHCERTTHAIIVPVDRSKSSHCCAKIGRIHLPPDHTLDTYKSNRIRPARPTNASTVWPIIRNWVVYICQIWIRTGVQT